jgi:membrane-associated phospholipid phosphatase
MGFVLMNVNIRLIVFILLFSASQSQSQSPYKLSYELDIPVSSVGIVLSVFDLYLLKNKPQTTIEEIESLSVDNINSFDRSAVYNYSEANANLSDILLMTSLISPIALMGLSNIRDDAEIITVMMFENALLYFSIPHLAKGTTDRYRPYAYNPDVPIEKRIGKEAKLSFFSGHTTPAFANAVFISKVFSEYYPDSNWKPYVWAANLTLATAVGLLRYTSGSHFPTDIILGAIFGSSIGYLIPLLHKNDDVTEPAATARPQRQISFKFRL